MMKSYLDWLKQSIWIIVEEVLPAEGTGGILQFPFHQALLVEVLPTGLAVVEGLSLFVHLAEAEYAMKLFPQVDVGVYVGGFDFGLEVLQKGFI